MLHRCTRSAPLHPARTDNSPPPRRGAGTSWILARFLCSALRGAQYHLQRVLVSGRHAGDLAWSADHMRSLPHLPCALGVARFPDAPVALATMHPAWWLLVMGLRYLGSACLSFFCYLFPDGRFVPSWTRWVAFAWVLLQLPEFFFPGSSLDPLGFPPLLQAAGFLVLCSQLWWRRSTVFAASRHQYSASRPSGSSLASPSR